MGRPGLHICVVVKIYGLENRVAILKLDTVMTRLLSRCRKMAAALGAGKAGYGSLLLFFEIFVALSLSVSYYFQVRTYAIHGDGWNDFIFRACSTKDYRLGGSEIFETWKGRLSGMLLSGMLYDHLVDENSLPHAGLVRFNNIFGLYHAFWLWLLFLTIICALRNSLLINLGIYAGLMYNFSDSVGPHFYPWDLPAILFFTLAVILYQRRHLFLMSAVICTGVFFKETVLLCALLPFFSSHWKWRTKILTFLTVTLVFLLGKKFLLSGLHLKTAVLSMGDATSLTGLLNGSFLVENIRTICTPAINHVLFANAGTLVVMLLLGWHKRFRPYTLLVWLFVAGQMVYGTISEYRIFGEVLPLSWILLIGCWKDWNSHSCILQDRGGPDGITGQPPGEPGIPDTTWAVRGTGRGLAVLVVALVILTSSAVAWRYGVLADSRSPGYQTRLVGQLNGRAEKGDPQAQFELGKHYLSGEGVPANLDVACEWLRKAAGEGQADAALLLAKTFEGKRRFSDAINCYYQALQLNTNSAIVLNRLAWLRATAADPRLRNGEEAVRLAERACRLTQYKEAILIGTLAAAYAEVGRFDKAVDAADTACTVAVGERQVQIAAGNTVAQVGRQVLFALQTQQLVKLYRSGRAYHQEDKESP